MKLSNYAYMLMLSVPLIVTPLWPSICKPMNSLEVSRIAGFYTDISKKIFLGFPLNTTPPIKVLLTQCKSLPIGKDIYFVLSHYTADITPKMSDTLTLLYIFPCIDETFVCLFVFFFAYHFFGKKLCPPLSSLRYTIMVVQI